MQQLSCRQEVLRSANSHRMSLKNACDQDTSATGESDVEVSGTQCIKKRGSVVNGGASPTFGVWGLSMQALRHRLGVICIVHVGYPIRYHHGDNWRKLDRRVVNLCL